MLIEGSVEWSEAWFATGIKTNLLQNGYNPKMQVSAMSLGPTVVITRYKDTDGNPGLAQYVLDQPTDTLILHQDRSNSVSVDIYLWRKLFRVKPWHCIVWLERCDVALSAGCLVPRIAGEELAGDCFIVSSGDLGGHCFKVLFGAITKYAVNCHAYRGISANLKGSVDIDHLQRMSWNPCNDVLLACSKTDIVIIVAIEPALSYREIYTDSSSTYRTWGASSWSPSGLQVSIAQNHVLHCFSWTDVESLLSESPKHDHIDARTSLKDIGTNQLNTGNASVGPIAAVARVSPTVCILTTDTKLIVEDITRPDLATASVNMEPQLNGTGSASTLLLRTMDSHCQEIREHGVASSSDVLDLTSIRVSTSSIEKPFHILNHIEVRNQKPQHMLEQCLADLDTAPCETAPHVKSCSHLLVVEYKAGKWIVSLILDLPQLTSPDVLVVQVHLIHCRWNVIRRNHTNIVSDCAGDASHCRKQFVPAPNCCAIGCFRSHAVDGFGVWRTGATSHIRLQHISCSIKFYLYIELPPMHVCRGLYLAKKSSFVGVAFTKKCKRATFFHAVANMEPLSVYLSNFILPQCPRSTKPTVKQIDKVQKPTAMAVDNIIGSLGEDKHNGGENKDLLDLILANVMAMQNQLNTRFDDVDKKLLQLMVRMEQLERNSTTNK
ncbi:hypothetical protein DD238_002404 [Peronospora effusa]|uniref:WD repeat and coiled-coil-containing protein n=1 Tax=Peronospora effusa TaxID=542832 RepID=A0A3M6VM19_9STRA|nr:hypothetical protein DD238_002404 [Peronospora effusa]RQM16041.1 hypothetical protein DD237_002346 [Peronospora effusa]